jgi:hypothetical protein
MVDFRRALGDENLKNCDELDKYWSILDSNGKLNPSELGHKTPVHSYPWDMCFERIPQHLDSDALIILTVLVHPALDTLGSTIPTEAATEGGIGTSVDLQTYRWPKYGLCRDQICSAKCRFVAAMVKTQCITGHCHIYIYDHIYIYIPYWKIKHNACTNPNNGLKTIHFYGNRNQV